MTVSPAHRTVPLPQAALQAPQRQRKADGYGQIDQGDNVVGLKIAEVARRGYLAELRHVQHAEHRDQGTVFHQRDKVISERRKDGPDRLWKDDEPEPVPARKSQRLAGLDLPRGHGREPGPEHFRNESRIGDYKRQYRPPQQRKVALSNRVKSKSGTDPVECLHQRRRQHEGDVEQQNQNRHATHDFDIETRELAHETPSRRTSQCKKQAQAGRESETDQGDQYRDFHALQERDEYLPVLAVRKDVPERVRPQRQHGDKPPGKLPILGCRSVHTRIQSGPPPRSKGCGGITDPSHIQGTIWC